MAQFSPSLHVEPLLTYDEATCLSPLPAVSAVPLEVFESVRLRLPNKLSNMPNSYFKPNKGGVLDLR
jgi:hypothetical protein